MPLVFFFGCEDEDDPPQAMPMNNCGTVDLSIDMGGVSEFFNGDDPELGYDCSMSSVRQTTQGVVCNIVVRLSLYNESGEIKYYLYFDGFKEFWGNFPSSINNPFDPNEIHFNDYDNLAIYSSGDQSILNDGSIDYAVDYDNQTLSGNFNINIEPHNQAQNNAIDISGSFVDIPFILYTQ